MYSTIIDIANNDHEILDADVENGLEDMGRGKGKLGRSESGMDIYTLPNVK